MLLSKCSVSGSKKSRFVKEQEDSGLLICLEKQTGLDKISIFWSFFVLKIKNE